MLQIQATRVGASSLQMRAAMPRLDAIEEASSELCSFDICSIFFTHLASMRLFRAIHPTHI